MSLYERIASSLRCCEVGIVLAGLVEYTLTVVNVPVGTPAALVFAMRVGVTEYPLSGLS